MTELSRKLQFDRPWSLHLWGRRSVAAEYRAVDEELLQRVINGDSGPAICISRYPRCLVSTVRESRMDGFDAARRELEGQGWPVKVRCTGGTCVPQGPGVLNLSIIHPQLPGWMLADGYLLLCGLLSLMLANFGLTPETGEVPGAFCDGKYNLQVTGRKLVGTAQRWAGSSRQRAAVLSHACLLVDLDLVEATEKINTLYALSGSERRFEPRACTTLREALGGMPGVEASDFFAGVEQSLEELVRDVFGITAETVVYA